MNKILEMKFGSTLYNTRTENSDLDLKAIYIPTAREIVLGTYKKTISTTRPKREFERNTKDDIDVEVFSLDRYLNLLCSGQTVALDMLFAPDDMFTYKQEFDHIWRIIKENKEKLLCKELTAFVSYAKQQASKYGLKGFRVAAFKDTLDFLSQFKDHDTLNTDDILPLVKRFVYERPCASPTLKNEYIKLTDNTDKTGRIHSYLEVAGKLYALDCKVKMIRDQLQRSYDQYGKRAMMAASNEGQDNKALSHAVRVNSEGIELLLTGNIAFPRPDAELLVKIKKGELHYNEVADIILKGLEDLKEAEKISILRNKPDLEWKNDFIYDIYSQIVRNG